MPVELYLNALIILSFIGGVLGVGYKAINGNGRKQDK